MSEYRHGLYLTTGRDDRGRLIAICSDGTPQRGHDPVTILTLEVVDSERDAELWFEAVKILQPWKARQ